MPVSVCVNVVTHSQTHMYVYTQHEAYHKLFWVDLGLETYDSWVPENTLELRWNLACEYKLAGGR
jgi:hypothetical protein